MASTRGDAYPYPSASEDGSRGGKKRTPKACDYCRAKKLKCDGGTPCSRCKTISNSCIYCKSDKPKVVRRRQTRKGAIHSLDNRIEKLEGLLSVLVTKLGAPSDSALPGTNEKLDNDQDETDEEVSSSEHTPLAPQYGLAHEAGDPLEEEDNSCIKYIGSQSTMSIFSEQGLSWICGKAKDPNCVKPVIKSLSLMNTVIMSQRETYAVPVTLERDVVPLPPGEEAYRFLEVYNYSIPFTTYIIEKEALRHLLDRYFSALENPQSKEKLSHAEILILYMMSTNGANYRAQEASMNDDQPKVLRYQRLEMQYLNSAFHYYQKVSIFGESIDGLRALLMLALYGDMIIIPDVEYIIGSVAIRLAQSLGLHRKEIIESYPKEEALRRKKLWYMCYMLDRTLCLHSGKPPIIHDDDISSLDIDFIPDPQILRLRTAKRLHISVDNLDLDHNMNHCDAFHYALKEADDNDCRHIVEIAWLRIAKITSKSYNRLFSATALIGKTRSQMMSIIGELNEELEEIKKSLPVSMRPGHPISIPKDSDTYQFDYSKIVRMHVSYNLVSMVINRIALSRHWGDYQTDEKKLEQGPGVPQLLREQLPIEREFSRLCIQACTEIIDTANSFINKDFNLWLTTMFTFFSALVTTITFCMENPTHPDTRITIERMISSLLYSFNDCYPKNRGDLVNFIKIAGMNLCLGVFVRISVTIFNNANPYNQITDNVENLIKKLFETEVLLTATIKEYKKQLQKYPNNRVAVTVSDVSIGETISNIYSRFPTPVSTPGDNIHSAMSSTSTATSGSHNSWSNKIPEPKSSNQMKSFSSQRMEHDIFTNSPVQPGSFGYPTPTSYNMAQPFGNKPASSNDGPLVPPSLDDILSTDDLSINWENFSHNLFNIPAPFMGEYDIAQNQGQNQNQDQNQQGIGSSYLL